MLGSALSQQSYVTVEISFKQELLATDIVDISLELRAVAVEILLPLRKFEMHFREIFLQSQVLFFTAVHPHP
jgi:hypothetical protein